MTFPKKDDDCFSFIGDVGLDGVLTDRLPPPSRTWPELDLGSVGVPVLVNRNNQELCRSLVFD